MADLTGALQAAAGTAASAGGAADPNFNQTVLLLHGDGTNGAQNNTFLDASTNNFTITRNGNTTQGTFSPFSLPDGRWSNYFDGTGDYLTLADNVAFEPGTGDFTLELWVYHTTTASALNVYLAHASSGISFFRNATGKLEFGQDAVGISATSTNNIPVNAWSHVAVSRSGTSLKLFIDGVQEASVTNSTNFAGSGSVGIGASSLNQFPVTGYLSNLRLIKGTALYTGAFTPPTAPLTAITNTSLLTCQSNRFVDNSSNAFAITRNGDVKVTPFSPFAPTAAYDASVNGGSGYFDGSGDAIYPSGTSADLALGSGDFTIEFWLYTPRGATRQYVLDNRSNGAGGFIGTVTGIGVIWGDNGSSGNGNQFRYFSQSSGSVIADADLLGVTLSNIANQWNHIAIVRSSGTVYGFLNGVRKNSVADATNFNVNTSISIGAAGDISAGFLGNISNFRVVKGTAVYTGTTYTVPTSPITAVSGTELLCNFTNAGIFDQTGKNNLETVGNAQIDTTTKKYGTGSMEFDGAGDYLDAPSSTEFGFLTGAFTVEFWVYLNTVSGFQNLFDMRSGVTNQVALCLYMNGASPRLYVSDADRITGSNISASQWYHIALTRSGTDTKLFVDGVQSGSTYTDSNSYLSPRPLRIGTTNDASPQNPLNGFIDDLRITKGIARYTTTFTPPTAAFPNL